MRRSDADAILQFIGGHYDMVNQEDWFDFQEVLLGIVTRDANVGGYAAGLVKDYPQWFSAEGE